MHMFMHCALFLSDNIFAIRYPTLQGLLPGWYLIAENQLLFYWMYYPLLVVYLLAQQDEPVNGLIFSV